MAFVPGSITQASWRSCPDGTRGFCEDLEANLPNFGPEDDIAGSERIETNSVASPYDFDSHFSGEFTPEDVQKLDRIGKESAREVRRKLRKKFSPEKLKERNRLKREAMIVELAKQEDIEVGTERFKHLLALNADDPKFRSFKFASKCEKDNFFDVMKNRDKGAAKVVKKKVDKKDDTKVIIATVAIVSIIFGGVLTVGYLLYAGVITSTALGF